MHTAEGTRGLFEALFYISSALLASGCFVIRRENVKEFYNSFFIIQLKMMKNFFCFEKASCNEFIPDSLANDQFRAPKCQLCHLA